MTLPRPMERRQQMLNENDAALLQHAFVEAIKECAPLIIADVMPLITKATTAELKAEFEHSVGRAVLKWAVTSIGAGAVALAAYFNFGK